MIIQMSLVRNELTLIKELLPIWKKYVDGFVFMLHNNTDGTMEYLNSVKEQYNILEILITDSPEEQLTVETDVRQRLFDATRKYTSKIICLDADEYLDGSMSKKQLEYVLDNNPDTVFYLKWVQYTSVNTVRTDGPWKDNYKDRIGMYTTDCRFAYAQNHSTHLPTPRQGVTISQDQLFIAHLQWLNKTYVAIKQYFWKVTDYVVNKLHNIPVVGTSAYDGSVNNFQWEEEYTFNLLKISPWLFDEMAIYGNYRLKVIKDSIIKHNIPDLGSWGYDFLSMDESDALPNRYKVSIITAIGKLDTYEQYIERWFENAQDQHFFRQTEHIIVYKEWSNLFNLFKNLPNFKLIEQTDSGMYNAWNLGIKHSTTPYITNWNIDDLRHPINTKIKFDLLENNPSVGMVYNWYVATTDTTDNFYTIDMNTKSYLQFPDDFHLRVLENCYAGPDPMWRKSLHDLVGYFDNDNYATIGDWEMWVRFASVGTQFKLIPEVLAIYLDHEQTVSRKQLDRAQQEKLLLAQTYTRRGI